MTDGPTADTGTTVVEISAAEGSAGADLELTARVTASPPCDLRGQTILIKDEAGQLLASAELEESEGGTATATVRLKAPLRAESVTWRAECPAFFAGGVWYSEGVTTFPVSTKAHVLSITVFDVPSAVTIGERVPFKVGVKCIAGCHLGGREIGVTDGDGLLLGTAALGPEPWGKTKGLFVAEFDLRAPDIEGRHTWQAKASWTAKELPHLETLSVFGIRTTALPECVVAIEAVDEKEKKPIAGAMVVMHPYRGVTDERGIAELRVRKGDYTILISKKKYDPMSRTAAVTGDMTTRVEMRFEPPDPSVTDIY